MGWALGLKETARGDGCGLSLTTISQRPSLFQGALPKPGPSRASGAQGHVPYDEGSCQPAPALPQPPCLCLPNCSGQSPQPRLSAGSGPEGPPGGSKSSASGLPLPWRAAQTWHSPSPEPSQQLHGTGAPVFWLRNLSALRSYS